MKQFSQKLFLATFLMLFTSNFLFAQLSGTKTIGTGGDYTSFALAVADLNAVGVGAGGVIFEFIDNGGGDFNETLTVSQAINPTINFPTATNTITFRPSTSLTGTVTLSGTLGTIFISFDANADYITLDGRKGGVGTTRDLTVINTNTASPTLRFANGASNNQVLFTKIQSRNTSTNSGAIAFLGALGGNNNNLIDNNEISPNAGGSLVNCIYSSGATPFANFNANNIISNNLIFDYFVATSTTNGVFLSSNNQAWSIIGNRFYQTAARTYTGVGNAHRAIQIVGANSDNYTITGNIIGFANSAGTGIYTMNGAVTTLFKGITISTATGGIASNIKNNIIQSISLSTTSGGSGGNGYFVGIEVSNGNVNVGGTITEGNSIGDNTTTGSISLASTSNGGFIQGIVSTSTGIINIQNNKIGSILSTGTAVAVSGIAGIQTSGSGVVANNIIGSTTTPNSINTTTTATGNIINVLGITILSTTSLTIDANIIANVSNGHPATNTSSITRGIHTSGSMLGALIVTNNEIYNISASGTHAGTGYNSAVLGGITCNGANTNTITGNKVYNLTQTGGANATNIYGIFSNVAGTNSNTTNNNLVYNLSSTSTLVPTAFVFVSIYGIRVAGTSSVGFTNVCANNVVRLGTTTTLAHTFYGIYDLLGNTNFYYNSVYIGGAGVVGGARTFALANDPSGTILHNVQNNIFVNARSNASTNAAKHYAASFNTNASLASNYNIFFASGTDGVSIGRGGSGSAGLVNYTTYKDYRVANLTLEVNSAFGNPQLLDPTNATTPDLSLGLLSPAFQTGTIGTGVTNDYSNVTRSATTPNIGAYETATTPQNATTDIFTPIITYTLLSTPYAVATGTRTLTATITDTGVGVPTSGANVPTLWYQNTSASGAWQSVAGTLTSGTGNNSTWDFVLDQNVLTLIAGQTVSYYVVAQDVATVPNIWYNVLDAAVNHTSVSTQVAAPTTPNTYVISGAMSGTYNVPGQFPSLTKVGGIFQAINNNTISGNIIVNIMANLDENGTYGLDTWADAGSNYTLLIQPSAGVQRIISNSANITTGIVLIRINTAVVTTIDGRFAGAGQFLLFRNTNTNANNTGGTISYTNTTAAKQSILQYAVIENNCNNTFRGNVIVGAGTNNVNINNCRIGDATGGTISYTRAGIYVGGGTTNYVNIQNNEIYNFLDSGVYLFGSADACIISNNKFYYNFVGAFPSAITGIDIQSGFGHTLANNIIGGNDATNSGMWDISSTAPFIGINLNGSNGASINVLSNTVKNINFSGTAGIAMTFRAVNLIGAPRAIIDNLTVDNIRVPTITSGKVDIQVVLFNSNTSTLSNSNFSNISLTNININASSVFYLVAIRTNSTYNILGNTFSNITMRLSSTNVQYIIGNLSGTPTVIVRNNTIFNIATTGTNGDLRIIYSNVSTARTTIVTGNRIYGITSSSGAIYGVYAISGNILTANNQISITNGAGVNPITIIGIYENTAAISTGQHYYNSVYIGGSQTSGTGAGVISACYRRDLINSIVDIRNNIFVNERVSTGASTIKNYVIASTTTAPATNWVSNYNLLVASGGSFNFLGISNVTTVTFTTWKTAQSADANSWTAIAGATTNHSNIIVANLFTDVANGNLNIQPANAESWFANGKGIAISTYTGEFGTASGVRSDILANGGTDLGSDEFVAVTTPIPALVGGSHTVGGTETFTFGGRQVAQIIWGAGGTLPVLSDMLYYSGQNPLNPTAGSQYFNAYWSMEGIGGAGYDYEMTLNYDKALLGGISLVEDASNTICLSKKPVAGTLWTTYTVGSIHVSSSNTLAKGALTSFSEFSGSLFVSPLPLTLLSFDAKRQNDSKIALNWLTTNELNLNYFVVERSYDAKSFVEVASLRAENPTTSIKNYILSVDEKKAVYFRLKFVHYQQNGIQSIDDNYSKVIFVGNGEEKESILVYPNPMNANSLSNVHFEVSKNLQNEIINLQITDNKGKTVASFVGTFAEIENIFSQNKLNLASGVYIWRFVVNNKTIKAIKISVE